MIITCWGARGSIPVSGPEYIAYGGDTTSIEIRSENDDIILVDAGSGIRRAGNRLIAENRTSIHLIFTHAHWDHLIGFPFFKPIYRSRTHIDLYGCTFAQRSVRNILAKQMRPPYFPVDYDDISADVSYHGLCEDTFSIGPVRITPIYLSHPNRAIGYRFMERGASFVFLTDNELTHHHPGGLDFNAYRDFSEGADLFIHDAEFTDRRVCPHERLGPQRLHRRAESRA